MKILFCVEFYYPSVGGAQEVVRQIAERLHAYGHTVSIATTRISSRNSVEHNGVKLCAFDISGNLAFGLHGEVDRYHQFLMSSDFDIVLFYAAQQWTFDAAWPVIDKISARKIFVPCGYSNLYDAAYRSYFNGLPATLKKMDVVVYHAENYRDVDFGAAHGLRNGTFIPNGADVKEFAALKDSGFRQSISVGQDEFVMLTVGTVTGLKGHLEVVQSFAEADFGQRKAALILNGNVPEGAGRSHLNTKHILVLLRRSGPLSLIRNGFSFLWRWCSRQSGYTESINAWAEKINREQKQKKVIVTNFSRERLIQAYLNSNLFVFASNIEYSPLVLFEACAAGLPFLAAPVGNASEIARWTEGGLICPAEIDGLGYTRVAPRTLARRMEELANDNELLLRLRESGRRACQRRFNWDLIAREYERLFEQTLNPSPLERGHGH